MTKNEKYAYLEESGWVTKSKGLWWKKDGENTRMNDAVDHQKELDAIKSEEWVDDFVEPSVKAGTPLVAEPDGNIRPMKPSDITIPESVKQTLDPYPHVSAGYAQEMLKAIRIGDEEMKKYQPKTYEDLTAQEERLHC